MAIYGHPAKEREKKDEDSQNALNARARDYEYAHLSKINGFRVREFYVSYKNKED